MFIFCRLLCFHSPYHKTHLLDSRQKRVSPPVKCAPSTSCVPTVMTTVTVRKENRGCAFGYAVVSFWRMIKRSHIPEWKCLLFHQNCLFCPSKCFLKVLKWSVLGLGSPLGGIQVAQLSYIRLPPIHQSIFSKPRTFSIHSIQTPAPSCRLDLSVEHMKMTFG